MKDLKVTSRTLFSQRLPIVKPIINASIRPQRIEKPSKMKITRLDSVTLASKLNELEKVKDELKTPRKVC
jgi:hypothetical protein